MLYDQRAFPTFDGEPKVSKAMRITGLAIQIGLVALFCVPPILLLGDWPNNLWLIILLLILLFLVIGRTFLGANRSKWTRWPLIVSEDGIRLAHPLLRSMDVFWPFLDIDRIEVIRTEGREKVLSQYVIWQGSPSSIRLVLRNGKERTLGPRSPDAIIRALNAISEVGKVRIVDQGQGRGTIRRTVNGVLPENIDLTFFKMKTARSPYSGRLVERQVVVDDGVTEVKRGASAGNRLGSMAIMGFMAVIGFMSLGFAAKALERNWVLGILMFILVIGVFTVLLALLWRNMSESVAEDSPLVVGPDGYDGFFFEGRSKSPINCYGDWDSISRITIQRTPMPLSEGGTVEVTDAYTPLIFHTVFGRELRTLCLDPDNARLVLENARSGHDIIFDEEMLWSEPTPEANW